jgi:peptidoglycan hydrolase-like protein with peptidoglycan-binding domain
VTSSCNESTFDVRCHFSLERSRGRRAIARRARRRRLRLRGGGLSAALVAASIAVLGAGAAVGQQAASSGSVSSGLLAAGAHGSAVSAVQRALGISASGVFDQETKAAVEHFQRRRGLLVDGIVGPQTRRALGLAPVAPSSSGSASTTQSAGGNASLQAIAQCESGGNPQAVGGGGRYRGKYQFTRETWQAVGGSGDPAAAPEAEQDQRAAMLYQRSGASNWPVCGR